MVFSTLKEGLFRVDSALFTLPKPLYRGKNNGKRPKETVSVF